MKAVIIGCTGLTGKALLEKLAASEDFSVITAISRRPVQNMDGKITYVQTDFTNIDSISFEADAAFSCLGTTIKKAGSQEEFQRVDYGYNLAFARLCKRNGVEKLLLMSALGADPASKIFYNRIKGELEEAIKELGFKTLVIIRPSLLEGPRSEFRFGEMFARMIMRVLNPVLRGRFKRYRSVNINNVAGAMVRHAINTEGFSIVESEKIV